MTTFMKGLLIFIAIIATPVIWYKIAYPTYSWNQKLTVEVETPSGIVSGSSVTHVEWSRSLFGTIWREAPQWTSKVQGEAVVVDLGGGRYLFALLAAQLGEREIMSDLAMDIIHNKLGRLSVGDRYRHLMEINHPMTVPQSMYPRLVFFEDIDDPKTRERLIPGDMEIVVGAGFRILKITLDITDEPVTRGKVEEVVKWLYTGGRGALYFIAD